MPAYDLMVAGGTVVIPSLGTRRADIAIRNGTIAAVGLELPNTAKEVVDASGKTIFPGVVDSHFHLGIFRPLSDDARTESGSAVAGGVTSILIYYRAGRNNLLVDIGPVLPENYETGLPRLLADAAGCFRCDYAFNLAPVTQAHVDEIPELIAGHGVTTFKYYMHYRGIRPGTSPEPGEKEYVFADTAYDLGHLHAMMEKIARENIKGRSARLSIHAEHPSIIRENSEAVMRHADRTEGNPLELYSRTRPPSGERLAILIAAELANQTGCPINILHVSSAAAMDAIREARSRYPSLDLMAETTVHHLLLANNEYSGVDAKVNPPIRTATDREALWAAVKAGDVQTIASDHAAITQDRKGDDIWKAWYGFGGTELLLPAVLTEAHFRRGISLERIAELLCLIPARYHGLSGRKGDIAVGGDADLVICDMGRKWIVDHGTLHSAQDFSPFDGTEMMASVDTTILRGLVVYRRGGFEGGMMGEYLRRPC